MSVPVSDEQLYAARYLLEDLGFHCKPTLSPPGVADVFQADVVPDEIHVIARLDLETGALDIRRYQSRQLVHHLLVPALAITSDGPGSADALQAAISDRFH